MSMATRTVTATDGNNTFTRKTTVAWTHAVITEYANGYAHVFWAKSARAAQDLATHKQAYIAGLTAADRAADPAHPVSAVVVETVATPYAPRPREPISARC